MDARLAELVAEIEATGAPTPLPTPTPVPGSEYLSFELIFSESFDTECAEASLFGSLPERVEGHMEEGQLQPRASSRLATAS